MTVRPVQTRYALVAPLPRAVEVRIEDAFLGLLGASKPIMGYHVTLVGPFVWAGEPDEHRLRRVAETCAAWPPLAVRIHGLSAFRATNRNALYIPVLESESLEALHRALKTILEPAMIQERPSLQGDYVPHITLGLGLTDSELERVMAGWQERVLDERFLVDSVHLLEEPPSAPWRSIRAWLLSTPHAPQGATTGTYLR